MEERDGSFVLMTPPPPSTVRGRGFQHSSPPAIPLPGSLSCSNLEQDLLLLLASVFIKLERTGHIIFYFCRGKELSAFKSWKKKKKRRALGGEMDQL